MTLLRRLSPIRELLLDTDLKLLYSDWWFSLCRTGGGLKTKEDETSEAIMKSVGIWEENKDASSLSSELSQFYSGWGWGHSNINRINEIYRKIEQLYQWS